MRTIKVKLYKFTELRKPIRECVLDTHRHWNTEYYDWWDTTYEDAKNIGLELTSCDLYRREIDGKLIGYVSDSIRSILKDHGSECNTYRTAAKYKELFQLDRFTRRASGDEDWEEEDPDRVDDYRKELLRDYLKMLDEEYKYLESDESIQDSFLANEKEFYADGRMA